jgi:hypothetical protein
MNSLPVKCRSGGLVWLRPVHAKKRLTTTQQEMFLKQFGDRVLGRWNLAYSNS